MANDPAFDPIGLRIKVGWFAKSKTVAKSEKCKLVLLNLKSFS